MSKKTSRTTAMVLCAAVSTGLLSSIVASNANAAQSFSSYVVAGSANKTDASGRVWTAAPGNFVGAKFTSTNVDIVNTKDDAVFQQEAYDMSAYNLAVPYAGTYKVTLPMAELYWSADGKRVFSVSAEGKTVLSDVDIHALVGRNTAYRPSFRTTVTDGKLNLGFTDVADFARVAGVQVEYVGPASSGTATTAAPTTAAPTTAAPTATATKTATPTATATATKTATPTATATATPTSSSSASQAVKFAPNNIFSWDISKAPVASNSAAMVSHLNSQVVNNWGGVAATNAYQYNASFYTVSANTPKYNVKFDDCQGKGYTPSGLFDGAAHFKQIPIPNGAVPATGTDGNLSIYDPAADKLWELWVASKNSDGSWKACWGGRIDNVSKNEGTFDSYFGTTATGISFSGSMITVDEVRKGAINHAMYLAIMEPAMWNNFSWPAKRSDGWSTNPNAVPEGTRLRLDPSINVDSLALTPFGKMVAKAAQKYGFIVADKAGTVNVSLESGSREKAVTGTDPWKTIFGSTPDYQQLKNFPWAKLQALPKDYGKP